MRGAVEIQGRATSEAAPAQGVDPDVALGARIRGVRNDKGISLREFARRLEVSPATISAIERGQTRITAVRLSRVAEVLTTSLEVLLTVAPPAVRAVQSPLSGPTEGAEPGAAPLDWRQFPPLELDPPLQAALDTFLELGYHGSPVRDIAQRAGFSVAGVYHRYPSKQHMLVAILDITIQDLLVRATAARAEGRDAVERFCLLIECLALYHTHRRDFGFVGASEMRSLVPKERARVVAERRAQQQMVDEEVEQACLEGMFRVEHPHEASRAIVTMCTALPQWFDGKGTMTPDQVAAQYVGFGLDLMRCRRRQAAPARRSGRPPAMGG